MNKKRTLIMMLLIFLGLCITYAIIVKTTQEAERRKEEESVAWAEANTIYLIPAEDITGFSYQNGEAYISFSFDDEWKYDFDENFICSQTKVEAFKELLLNLTAIRAVDMTEEKASYGLEEPAYSIEITDNGNKKYQLYVGDIIENGNYYVSIDDDSRIFTISNQLVGYLSRDLMEFVSSMTVPELSAENVTEIYMTDGEKILQLKHNDTEWSFSISGQNIEQSGIVTNKAAITDILETMNGFGGQNCVDYYCDEEEKVNYGLMEPAISVEAVYTAENGMDISYYLYIGEAQTETSFYFMNSENNMVGTVAKTRVDALKDAFTYTYRE